MKTQEELRVVFVRFLRPADLGDIGEGIPSPKTRSYCDAMRLCWSGSAPQGLLVTRDTIAVCKWCPAALGLKAKETGLERKLECTMDDAYEAVYLYSPTAPYNPGRTPAMAEEPDVAVVVGAADDIRTIVGEMDEGDLAMEYSSKLSVSALSTLVRKPTRRFAARARRAVKRASIALLNSLFTTPLLANKISVALVTQLFKSYAFSRISDPVIATTMAGASACVNTTVIPFLTKKANVSFVDAGTIGWADLKAGHRILGIPMRLYRRVESRMPVSPRAQAG